MFSSFVMSVKISVRVRFKGKESKGEGSEICDWFNWRFADRTVRQLESKRGHSIAIGKNVRGHGCQENNDDVLPPSHQMMK